MFWAYFCTALKIDFQEIQSGLNYALFNSAKLHEDYVRIEKTKAEVVLKFQYSGIECVLIDPSNPNSSNLVFKLDKKYLDAIDTSLYKKIETVNQAEYCCNTQAHLHELLKSQYKGLEQKIYMQSKVLQLVLCLIEQPLVQSKDCNSCKFLSKDFEREKIISAKDIILSSLNDSLTIPILAQRVGMNECYLKKGFKELYGKTIFAYVQDARMQRAKMLLNTEEMSVSEIAYEVGYSNLSGFSAAFKKQVGVLPSEFAMQ